ncbi:MAG: prolyl oligopeptidase family serine peptidase [Anaerolineales bacterium]|jgi:dipeptidyl aminopeptidase/acylaminoacyl peptidase
MISQEAAEGALRRLRKDCVPAGSQLEGSFDYYVYARQRGTWPLEVSGHNPLEEAGWFRAYEPVHNVTSDYPPTMLLHGRADTDVPFAAAERMAAALEEQGVEYEFVYGAEWNHVFEQMEALLQVLAFLDRHVKQ